METADLYQLYYPEVLRYLKRFLSESQAEDLAQDVFIKADRGLVNFRGDASPRTWLYRIATNTLHDFLRSRQHHIDATHFNMSASQLEQYKNTISNDISLEQDSIRTEMNDCIRDFIWRLPENYSSVLVLSDLEGHTNKEIADILSISLDTVKIRLHRARVRLKAELSQGCDFSRNNDNNLECQRKEK